MTIKSKNLITLLTTDVHSEILPFTYKTIINTLTGIVGSSLLQHIYAVKRGDVNPTLDERNEQDEDARGQLAADVIGETIGINWTPMPAYQTANIADGIRHFMYEELCGYGEYKEDALLHTPPVDLHAKVNYNQPMSLQMYLDFRVKMADSIDESKITFMSKHLDETEAVIRHALMEEAKNLKASLIRTIPEVMVEAASLNDVFDIDAFASLDLLTQKNFADKVSEKFSKEYQRVLAKAVRGDLEAASDLSLVKGQFNIIKDWLHNNDAEFRDAENLQKQLKAA